MGAPPPLKGEGMHFSSGRSAPTFFGWTPGLRHLVSGRLLACGCLVGLYETWDRSFVEIVDSIVEPCGVGHDVNHILMIKAATIVENVSAGCAGHSDRATRKAAP